MFFIVVGTMSLKKYRGRPSELMPQNQCLEIKHSKIELGMTEDIIECQVIKRKKT